MPGDIETSTNQVYRKKYFIDTSDIVGRKKGVSPGYAPTRRTMVIKSAHIKVADKPIPLRQEAGVGDDEMRIRVTREGDTLKEIAVTCPCGRTATLNVAGDGSKN